ncbi:MAG: SRPBCC domain-containing protein [Candidatus Pollutiaquabacter aromativorans]
MQWNHASDDWHCPAASNDLRVGGMLKATMAARDGSMSFDFGGIYSAVVPNQKIALTMGDGRNVEVVFSGQDDKVQVTETFDAESTHSIEMQRTGWQAILDNFKTYCEKV